MCIEFACRLERELAAANARAEAAITNEIEQRGKTAYWEAMAKDVINERDAAESHLREVAALIRGMSCPFPFSDNKSGDVGYCLDNKECACKIKITLEKIISGDKND
jgi:hypothetical protein